MNRYRLRLNIIRTYEADVEIEATSPADARAQAAALNVEGLLLRQTNADQVDVVSAYASSTQKVA